jgi:hypothetical protein
MSESEELRLAPEFKGPVVMVSLLFIFLPISLNLMIQPRLLQLPHSLNKSLAIALVMMPLLFAAGMGWLLLTTLRETRLRLHTHGLEYYSPFLSLKTDWSQTEALVPAESGGRWNLSLKQPAEVLHWRLIRPPATALQQIPLFPFCGTNLEELETRLQSYQPKLKRKTVKP